MNPDTPTDELELQPWRTRLSMIAVLVAILIPAYFFGGLWWMDKNRNPSDQSVSPFLWHASISILGVLVSLILSAAAMGFNRRSQLSWCAAFITLLEVGYAVSFLLSLGHMRF